MMQLFVSDKGLVKVYRIKSVTEILMVIRMFTKEVGTATAIRATATSKRSKPGSTAGAATAGAACPPGQLGQPGQGGQAGTSVHCSSGHRGQDASQ